MKVTAVSALGLWLLVGCGTATTPDDAASTVTPTVQAMPLSEFLGSVDTEDEQFAKDRRLEDLVATCMAGHGFEYVPIDHQAQNAQDPVQQAFAGMGTREFAEKYGFGITLRPPIVHPDQLAVPDANTAIVEALSEAERAAYQVALHGTLAAETPAAAAAVEDATTYGCRGTAQDEVYGEQVPMDEDASAELWAEYDRRTALLAEEPKVLAASQALLDCMQQKGFAGDPDPVAIRSELRSQWWALHGLSFEDGTSAGLTGPPTTPDAAAVEEFKGQEIPLAVADFDCRSDYTEVYSAAQRTMEEKFVVEFAEVLEQYRASLGN